MHPATAKFLRSLLAFAMFFALGGQWMTLQVVAWSTMVIAYAQDGGLAKAVSRTFDGEHPCRMCITISEEKQKEQGTAPAVQFAKLELKYLIPVEVDAPKPAASLRQWPSFGTISLARLDEPPVPPPRLVTA